MRFNIVINIGYFPFLFFFLSWYPWWSPSGSPLSPLFSFVWKIRVEICTGRRGCGVMAVLPLKCYLNDKVVWLHGLRGVKLYTFTRGERRGRPRVWFTPEPRVMAPLRTPLCCTYNGHVPLCTCTNALCISNASFVYTCDILGVTRSPFLLYSRTFVSISLHWKLKIDSASLVKYDGKEIKALNDSNFLSRTNLT